MICKKCKKKIKGKYIEMHHMYPTHLGGTDKDGRIYLCKKHHKEIHNYLDSLNYILKEMIIEFTNGWINGTIISKQQEKFPMCPECKEIQKRLCIREVGSNYLILGCGYCGHKEKNIELYSRYIKRLKKDISIDNKKLFLKKIGVEGDKNDSIPEI